MKTAVILLASCAFLFGADRGLPARPNPSDYPAQASGAGIVFAADLMEPDQVRGSFSTDLQNYAVVEIALYPGKNTAPLDVSVMDFALRVDGRMVRPAEARSIAKINQKRSQPRSRDVTLYPSVGMTTGSWGTGVSTGVGVGIGPGYPGPASGDRDREVMEQELEDKGFQDGVISKPAAGYLYFPVGDSRKARNYVLVFQSGATDLTVTLPAPKKRP